MSLGTNITVSEVKKKIGGFLTHPSIDVQLYIFNSKNFETVLFFVKLQIFEKNVLFVFSISKIQITLNESINIQDEFEHKNCKKLFLEKKLKKLSMFQR